MSALFWWHWLTATPNHVAYLLLALAALISATCIAWLAWGAKHAPMEEELWPATARTRGMGELHPHDPIWADTLASARAKANPYDALGSDQ